MENRLDAMGVNGRKNASQVMALLEERKGRKRLEDSGLRRRFEEIALDVYKAAILPEPYFEYAVRLGRAVEVPGHRLSAHRTGIRGCQLHSPLGALAPT